MSRKKAEISRICVYGSAEAVGIYVIAPVNKTRIICVKLGKMLIYGVISHLSGFDIVYGKHQIIGSYIIKMLHIFVGNAQVIPHFHAGIKIRGAESMGDLMGYGHRSFFDMVYITIENSELILGIPGLHPHITQG